MRAKVLFICVENSCRSQMAEGFAKKMGEASLEAYSAGSKPSGKINETAVRLMKEKGIDLSAHRSKGVGELPETTWDYVITMGCGDRCPSLPARNRQDWQIDDPKLLPEAAFRRIRDQIEEKIKNLVHKTSQDFGKI